MSTFSLQKLNGRHYKILDLCLSGLLAVDIAKQLDMSATQVNNIIRSPSFQHQFAVRRQQREEQQTTEENDEVKQILQDNAKTAADKITGLLNSVDEKIVLKSATEILDRTGYPKEQQQSINDNSINVIVNKDEFSILIETLDMLN